jgi:hypothetical protein
MAIGAFNPLNKEKLNQRIKTIVKSHEFKH